MKLPNLEQAEIPKEKITEYLLSTIHRDGRHKAAFFIEYGFSPENWSMLADALRRHATENTIAKTEQTPFGIRYIVLRTPDGRTPLVRVVWFVEQGENIPRLATAYPLKRPRPRR